MKVTDLRNYGMAFSEAETAWTPDFKAWMRKTGLDAVMRNLSLWERLRFGLAFLSEQRRMKKVDLSEIRARGMNDERFLTTQIEYLALYSALCKVLGEPRGQAVFKELIDATAPEALRRALPEAEDLRSFPSPFDALREYLRPGPEAAQRAGCQRIEIVEDNADAFQFDVSWCVWLELARALGAPGAATFNCYSDDITFPALFASIGVKYQRTETLAHGGRRCDFRFERARP